QDEWARGALERALLAEPDLDEVGLAIDVAEDAATALATFRLGRPDLAVIDLALTDEPGDVLAATLRREPDAAELPIAFVSSAVPAGAGLARLPRTFGARHFTRPHGLPALVDHVSRVLVGGDEPLAVEPLEDRSGTLATRPLPAVLFDLFEARATGRLSLK